MATHKWFPHTRASASHTQTRARTRVTHDAATRATGPPGGSSSSSSSSGCTPPLDAGFARACVVGSRCGVAGTAAPPPVVCRRSALSLGATAAAAAAAARQTHALLRCSAVGHAAQQQALVAWRLIGCVRLQPRPRQGCPAQQPEAGHGRHTHTHTRTHARARTQRSHSSHSSHSSRRVSAGGGPTLSGRDEFVGCGRAWTRNERGKQPAMNAVSQTGGLGHIHTRTSTQQLQQQQPGAACGPAWW